MTCFYPKEYGKGGKTVTVMITVYYESRARDLPASFEEIRCHVVRKLCERELYESLRSESCLS